MRTGQNRRSIKRDRACDDWQAHSGNGGPERGRTGWSFAFAALMTILMTAALRFSSTESLLMATPAVAQSQQFVLNVAPVMLAEPSSRSPFPIQVGPQEALIRNSFVRIRGLPTAAVLSEGHSISPGAWAVPLTGLASLSITLPVGVQGRWDATVALVTIEGTVLTESKTVVVVGPVQLIAPQQEAKGPSQTNVASLGQTPAAIPSAPGPQPSPTERERALGLHAKGKELLDQGNIQPARMLFRRAAEQGLAESALALGGTYDPDELAKLRVLGLQPDVAAARRWYDTARKLGAAEAAERLRRLEGR